MSYHDAVKRLVAWNSEDCIHCGLDPETCGCWAGDDGGEDQCPDCLEESIDCVCGADDGDDTLDNEEKLRQRITDAMPEGDPEAYMASGQELLDELLANPDRTKLKLILDKEIAELNALLGGTGDIDLEELKNTALAAFDAAVEKSGPSRNAVMAALVAIKGATARALGALGLGG